MTCICILPIILAGPSDCSIQLEKFPPPRDAFIPNYRGQIIKKWNGSRIIGCNQNYPPLSGRMSLGGWTDYTHYTCEISWASESILRLMKCSRAKTRCSPPNKYLASSLPCTELCECSTDEEQCDNVSNSGALDGDDTDDDDFNE